MEISSNLNVNIACFEQRFLNCDDIVKRKFPIGKDKSIEAYIAYIDVMVDRQGIEDSVLNTILDLNFFGDIDNNQPKEKLFSYILQKGLATVDYKMVKTIEETADAIMGGDTVLFFDGIIEAVVLSTKSFPGRGVQEPDTEVVIRGSKEGFTESLRINTVLIRRRIKDTQLKVKQSVVGERSKTSIAIMYMEDIVRPGMIEEIERRLDAFNTDSVLDSGILEQLIETKKYSLFPQTQATQRPDKAASALMEGRVALVVDTSPFVILLPTTLNCFFQASDDYYNRWGIASLVRVIRYLAAFIAMALPGGYIAVTNFHPEMLPTPLVLSFAAAREGVPFPVVIEVILMELAFELLREAGIRLPGPIGSTIGIVGGLIIGQAAVSANLVSPIIVIIVALTAISSFAVPNDIFTSALRILKFFIIFTSAFLGLYGFWLAILVVLIHLAGMKSFDIPYLMPMVASNMNDYSDVKDSIVRFPTYLLKQRPIFSQMGNKKRLDIKKGENNVFK